ncbi:ATP-binding cassette domain-containing protein [Pseudidiomarina terrestris]|uniref:ATP-binding cassette domain-containing protein n=1 Tax=Pseudidiomarina terrestris TaxID=2820060 RepID=UPI0026560211|nr:MULTISPECIES: ATP-binding cassette domain-containing protein [unclassified Pseudidiomarina]MDN7134244.1 ATP-binding cassette domain-containing protein [Pseudidiomarina sp. 1ASP75-5]MDN7137068.1 ATP-binding cassette domain-containing protein [Pseudidiomarina sp. 1ASP75-14]
MISIRGMALMRGGNVLLENTDLAIFPGHHVGIVGRNGTGKSSLFALLRGELQVEQGECDVPSQWRIASVKQETPALDRTALDYVLDGDTELRQLEDQLSMAEQANDGHAIGRLHDQLAAIGAYEAPSRAASLLSGLGFTDAQFQQPVKAFSGGWRMRLNLAQALIARADLLLLDEPTNHLDVDAIFWLEDWLQRFPGTLLLISHDRDCLDAICQQIIHIEQQTATSYTGNYSSFERQQAEQIAQQQAQFEKEQAQRKHLQTYIDRFRYKASKAKQAQSRIKALERLQSSAPIVANSQFQFRFRKPMQLPNPLLTLENVQAGYGDTVILRSIKFDLVPGSRIGLLGRNGAGKSTLVKLLAGELAPQSGTVALNSGIKLGYFAQHQLETLDLKASALQHVQRLDPQASEQQLRDFLGGFGFTGDQATRLVAPMSGGEKARLVLALIVYQKPNLLLLDEPTNHLDSVMREALVYALQDFEGAMVIVSHDRHLLRTCVDDFFLVADGQVSLFNDDLDGYHRWLQDRQRPSDNTSSASSGKADRKAEKRDAAERRKRLKPFKDAVERYEKQVHKHENDLAELNTLLGDNSLYEDANKQQLQQLLQQQTQAQQLLQEAEEAWMSAEEALQHAEAQE